MLMNKVGGRTWIIYNVSIGDFVVITHEKPFRIRNTTFSVKIWHVVTSDGASLSVVTTEPTTTVYAVFRHALRCALDLPETWDNSDRLRCG